MALIQTIVTEFGVDPAFRDPGSSPQFAGRGRHGSTFRFVVGCRPVAAQAQDGASPKTTWVAAPIWWIPSQLKWISLDCFRRVSISILKRDEMQMKMEGLRKSWSRSPPVLRHHRGGRPRLHRFPDRNNDGGGPSIPSRRCDPARPLQRTWRPPRHLVTPGDEPPAVLLRSAESPPGISWTADGGRLLCFEPLTAELWFFYYSLFSRMEEADLSCWSL